MSIQFSKIARTPAYRALASAITEQILDGRLPEGAQLPTEAQLCEVFGVNRSTVREGIRVLEEAHLLRRESAKKLVVSRPSTEQTSHQFKRALLLHEVSCSELWEALIALEPAMARHAAQRHDEQLIAQLRDNLARTAETLSREDRTEDLDIEFHALIGQMCGNRALMLAREPLSSLFYPTFQAVLNRLPGAGLRMLEAHTEIFEAIREGDPEAAQLWMHRHIRDFKRGCEMAKLDMNRPIAAWENGA